MFPSLRWIQILLLAPVAFAGGTVGGGVAWELPRDAWLQVTEGAAPLFGHLVSGGFAMALVVLSTAHIATLIQRPDMVRSA